ncbi:hypothetical protein L9F63_016626 [Diploptera punctata]|uniref:WD repeat-containing protein 18 n=1 Tax=Diploptera punctata TaxID=6984 RepID=A0AAD8A0F6_DIPPU|nr:hypothetical protein L9F63_016626 [Diploptera punctata]
MTSCVEVAITSEGTGQLWSACVWNPRAGTTLMTYKGGGVAMPRSLCLLGADYLMLSDQTRPILQAWPLNSQTPVFSKGIRLVCPGIVNCMAVSPDGNYCVTAVAEKLHVWQMSTGRHLAVAVRHFQSVNCVKFTDDGSHFVSGGEDGCVLVWALAYLISENVGDIVFGHTEPRYMFSDHALPVKDLYVGHGGIRARLISVSADRTCKLYDLASGTLLLSLIYDCGLTAVTMDLTEMEVFIGGVDGLIYQFGLHSPPRMREYYLSKEQKAKTFSGHTKAISCLSTSKDGLTLLSGSLDACVMLWHIPSRQCIKLLQHKGPITNAFFTIAPKNIFSEEIKPSIILQSFKKGTDVNEKNAAVSVRNKESNWYEEPDEGYDNLKHIPAAKQEQVDDNALKEQIVALRKINSDLYNFAKKSILQTVNGTSNHDVTQEEKSEASYAESSCSESSWKPSKKIGKKKRKLNKRHY